MVVFLPIAFLPGTVGKFLSEFALVVVVATLTSLAISFTITPSLAGNWSLLSQWKPPPLPISAVYPHNRHLSATVRTFVDWIAELFRNSALLTSTPDADARCRPTSIDTQDADLIELADDEERPTA